MQQILFYFILSFLVSAGTIAALLPLARRLNWVDHPNHRKNHDAPTPVIGGLGVFVGIAVPVFMANGLNHYAVGWFTGALLLVIVGLIDDRVDVRWYIRLVVQITAALCLIFIADTRAAHLGPLFGLPDIETGWFSVPLSVFAIVGLINALNMADGIDGLVGSLIIASLIMFICAGIYAGIPDITYRLMWVVGAVLGFLWFNLRFGKQTRARVFLGDTGSALLGYTLAYITFRLTQNSVHPITPILAPYLIAVPIIDCVVLMVRRWRHGQSPVHADRNHIHHLMLDAGFSVNQILRVLVLLSFIIGLAAAAWLSLNVPYEKTILLINFILMTLLWYALSTDRDRIVARLSRLHRLLYGTPA
ncbi:MAG: glycosyltransferase family 4 protein [Arenimonas sp.]|uniref:glycosyltransferase family 4 protein n=1 Tax=Arenimonas sp. TaxID=1872635 RepID=UPI003C0DD86F